MLATDFVVALKMTVHLYSPSSLHSSSRNLRISLSSLVSRTTLCFNGIPALANTGRFGGEYIARVSHWSSVSRLHLTMRTGLSPELGYVQVRVAPLISETSISTATLSHTQKSEIQRKGNYNNSNNNNHRYSKTLGGP